MKVIKVNLFTILLVFFIVSILVILGIFVYKVINEPVTGEIQSNQFEKIEKENIIEGKYYFITEIPIEADDVSGFSESRARIMKNNKWGYIDNEGNVVVQLNYDYLSSISDNLGIGLKDDQYYILKISKK